MSKINFDEIRELSFSIETAMETAIDSANSNKDLLDSPAFLTMLNCLASAGDFMQSMKVDACDGAASVGHYGDSLVNRLRTISSKSDNETAHALHRDRINSPVSDDRDYFNLCMCLIYKYLDEYEIIQDNFSAPQMANVSYSLACEMFSSFRAREEKGESVDVYSEIFDCGRDFVRAYVDKKYPPKKYTFLVHVMAENAITAEGRNEEEARKKAEHIVSSVSYYDDVQEDLEIVSADLCDCIMKEDV